MEPGNCRMNGGGGLDGIGSGGGGGGGDSSYGMITLEDLESFSEDQLSDSGTGSLEEEGETMEDEGQQDRLLRYWQDAARGHQVEVPRDMAEPIQQITSNNDGQHDRERVPFTLITRKEKTNVGKLMQRKRVVQTVNLDVNSKAW